jgi:hypothetical protein
MARRFENNYQRIPQIKGVILALLNANPNATSVGCIELELSGAALQRVTSTFATFAEP